MNSNAWISPDIPAVTRVDEAVFGVAAVILLVIGEVVAVVSPVVSFDVALPPTGPPCLGRLVLGAPNVTTAVLFDFVVVVVRVN